MTSTHQPSRLNVPSHRLNRRLSMASDSSESSTPERELYDDGDSMMELANDSQSSLGVSLEDMDLDRSDYEERCRVSPISRLPAEILIAVFAKLSSVTDVKNCILVSKAWARNSVDLLWHRPDTRDWKNLLTVIKTARKRNAFFAYHELIKRLNLAQLGDWISDGTLGSIANCKRIERLTLTSCRLLTDQSVAALIEGNRNLLAIDVSNLDQITDISLMAVANNCYRLQGLNVTKCIRISDESLVAIAKNCRRIKRLKFNDCSQLTDYSILAFADNCHDMLEIDCAGLFNLTDISVTTLLTEGRQLRELRLQHCARITDEAFLQLPHDAVFEALRILDLTDCTELQDAGLHKIVTAAPRLRNLVLAKCRGITDRGVLSVTRLGKNLHYIHLGHCSRITDYGVMTLVRHCNRIRYIDLACCQHLTDASVSMLALLPKLKRIGLVKCQLITDDSLKALAGPKPHSLNMLERLHLSYCTLLTVAGVRRMLVNCPRLTHLSLTGVNEFLEPELLQFCREAPPEFNEHQREMFCVYSGEGVNQLREWLMSHYPPDDVDIDIDSDATIAGPLDYSPDNDPDLTAGALRFSYPHLNRDMNDFLIHPLPTHPILPGRPNGITMTQHLARFSNVPPPPPPPHVHLPLALAAGLVQVNDDDEDLDEDMRVGDE